jgi:hypothetical protein
MAENNNENELNDDTEPQNEEINSLDEGEQT